MITTSNSPVQRERDTQSIGVLLHTIAWYELSRVRTELFQLLVIPSLAHHPVHPNRQSARHRDLGDLSSPAHHQMVVLAPPCAAAEQMQREGFSDVEEEQQQSLGLAYQSLSKLGESIRLLTEAINPVRRTNAKR